MANSLSKTKSMLAAAGIQVTDAFLTLQAASPDHVSPMSIELAREVEALAKDAVMLSDRITRVMERI